METANDTLTPQQIHDRMVGLQRQFEKARRQSEEAERSGREIRAEILELQRLCTHDDVQPEWRQDTAEMKCPNVCHTCGKEGVANKNWRKH